MLELPKEFIAKYRRLLGKEADDFLASFQMEADNGFHLNPLKDLRQFASLKRQAPIPWNRENGRYGKIFGESVAFLSGVAYSQEPSAQFVARVVDAQPGEKILDLAAAPGGKSTQIAADMNNQGLLIANEISFSRAKILSENIERSGITNCIVTNHRPYELAEHFENYFDKILLDAPCSGEGMFMNWQNILKIISTRFFWMLPAVARACFEKILRQSNIGIPTIVRSVLTGKKKFSNQFCQCSVQMASLFIQLVPLHRKKTSRLWPGFWIIIPNYHY